MAVAWETRRGYSSLSTMLASRERVGQAGDCASATNNSFLVALRLRFMNERRTGTRFPSRSSPRCSPHASSAFISLSPTDPRPSRLCPLPPSSLSLFLRCISSSFLSSSLSIAQRSRTASGRRWFVYVAKQRTTVASRLETLLVSSADWLLERLRKT